jgi:hypothetical protein
MSPENLCQTAELRPFIPTVKELQARMAGIEQHQQRFGLELADAYHTEEQLFHDLLTQEVFTLQVNNEHNEHWDILREPFNQFMTRSTELTFATKHNTPERSQAICQWLIQLCDWSQSGFSNVTRH